MTVRLARGPKPIAVADIFWARVEKRGIDECWPFSGCTTTSGYGDIKSHQKRHLAHRVSFEIHKGAIPSGLFVCHSCDNPRCCNPAHLWLGRARENVRDMVAKGRHKPPCLKGSENGNSKLTAEIVTAMRLDPRPGTHIAAAYGLSAATVNAIRSGRTWRHIPMPADAVIVRVGRPKREAAVAVDATLKAEIGLTGDELLQNAEAAA